MQYFLYKRILLSRLCLTFFDKRYLTVSRIFSHTGIYPLCISGLIFNRLFGFLVEYLLPNAAIITNMFVFWVLYQRMERTLTKSLESIQKVG
jgi:hypothetical protein